jgi:hypothetical protein
MARKTIIFVCIILCLLFFSLNLISSSIPVKSADKDAGYALLDSLVVTFKEMAELRESVFDKANKELEEMMREAMRAKAQNQIDAVFFKRFSRILLVLKLVIGNAPGEVILTQLMIREVNQFIEDVEAVKFDVQKAGGATAINTFSQAISHEIVNLRIYLDNKGKREKLIEEYQEHLAISKDTIELVQQDKQLMSMRDITFINHAITDYLTDMGVPPKQEGTYDKTGKFYSDLSPFYIKVVPIKDNWGNNLHVYTGKTCNGVYDGIEGCTEKDFIIISYGRDGEKESWKYDSKNPQAGIYELKSMKDLDKDLIMWNGNWVRAPMRKKK